MATRKNGVEGYVKDRLTAAEKRLVAFEDEAQRVLQDLIERGRSSREQIQDLIKRAGELELGERAGELKDRAEHLKTRAEKVPDEVARRLEKLQDRALAFVGVASQIQVEELASEIDKLSRKIDKLAKAKKKAASRKGAPRAP